MQNYRIDASPSYKGNSHPQPSRSTPVNTVTQSQLYGRGGVVDQHASAALDRSGRFVTFQSGQPPPPSTHSQQQQQQQISAATSAFRNAEERGGPRPHRMSLLHPLQPPPNEYNIPQGSSNMTPRTDRPSQQGPPYGGESSGMGKVVPSSMSESPPCKKLRLGDAKSDVHLPLRIDTDRARSGPAYNPQVEAISPTLPSEPLRDESPLRSTKEDLMQQLARLDREIAKTESQIAKLKKKKVELEEAATQPERNLEEPAGPPESMNRSLPHIIYAENRKKALEAHQILSKLGPPVDIPLYNQPSDTVLYHENKIKYASLKAKLQEYFKNKVKEKEKRETYLTTTYAKLSADWARRLEKIENNTKKRAKDAKTREIFEKVFPELRKQREDKERFSRVGSRIKSDADLEEIMDGLHEQELEDKKMRSYAVIPPIILDEKSRRRRFNNRNGLIEDPMQEYKDKQLLNVWTEQEKDIFKEKYLQHPKNFSMIKSYLERKSVADCVQYYYLSKKAQNYRQLLRKNRARTRSTRNQQNSAASGNSNSNTGQVGVGGLATIKTETNGVTTRGQKEQVKNEQQQQSSTQQSTTNSTPGIISSNSSAAPSAPPTSTSNIAPSAITANNGNGSSANNGIAESTNAPTAGTNGSGSTGASSASTNQNNLQGNPPSTGAAATMSTSSPPETSILSMPPTGPTSEFIGKSKGKRQEGSKELTEMDSTDDENEPYTGEKGVPHACVVCKTTVESYMHSRPLLRNQFVQFGLSESDYQHGDRVCNSCRCKSVRHRYKPSKQCPIPTCPAKKARVKRLRPFPAIWKDLSEEKREAIIAKYQIPPTATKCCTACFNRINRRLSPNASLDTPDDPGSDTTRWTDEEIDTMKRALVELGTDWRRLSERINTKSDLQCRNFYFNFRKKYGLDGLVQEYKKSKGSGDGPPTLTDEEESGSTTSSCDETAAHSAHDQSPRHHDSSNKNKDDYDSSATVSAEEGGAPEIPTEKPNSLQELKILPTNPGNSLTVTARPGQPGSSHPVVPPIQSRIQPSIHHHGQENGGQAAISLVSSHHSGSPSQQHPQIHIHSGHTPATVTMAMGQRSSPNTMSVQGSVSVQQQHQSFHSTPVISHCSSQLNHHSAGPIQAHQGLHVSSTHVNLASSHHANPHSSRGMRYPSPEGPDAQEPPISVRVDDLMSATIERHLRRNPPVSTPVNAGSGQLHPGPSVSPTLQSILKSQPPPTTHHMLSQIPQSLSHGSSLNPQNFSTQAPSGPPQTQQQQLPPQSMPQGIPVSTHISVQAPSSSPHFPPHHHSMGYGSGHKVDVRQLPQIAHHMVPREVSIVQLPARDDCGTLDLSMKKRPASPGNMSLPRPSSNGPPPAHQPLDFASRGPHQPDMYGYQHQPKFTSASIQRHPPMQNPASMSRQPSLNPPPPKQAKVPPPPALITKPASLSPMKDGSITHGTPIHSLVSPQQLPTKFETGIIRTPGKEGSITQGTPKGAMPTYVMYERPPSEYFKRMSPAGSPYGYHASPSYFGGQRPPSTGAGGQRSPPVHPSPQTSPFSSDQHNSSRQIIINDYYTSQQMQQPVPTQHPPQPAPSPLGQPRTVIDASQKRNVGQSVGAPIYMLPHRQEVSYRQSPPPSSIPTTQHRQGVIQRANTNRPIMKDEHGGRYPQHDAFTSLVDVASSAPSLPVPKEENRKVCLPRVDMVREGLGKSMVDIERSRVGQPLSMAQPNHPPSHAMPPQHQTATPHIYRPGGMPANVPSTESMRIRAKQEAYSARDSQDSTLTAASLIDAIITHQINQPSPSDRQSPVPTNRTGDRLFASFQRSPSANSVPGGGPPQHHVQNLSIPNQIHGHGHGPSPNEEKMMMNDSRAINHKLSSGGGNGPPWNEQINLMVQNEYQPGKVAVIPSSSHSGGSGGLSGGGIGMLGPGGVAQMQHMHGHQQGAIHSNIQNSHSVKKAQPPNTNQSDEDAAHYKSWKLRKALQLEKEQQQQQAMHMQQSQSHPDERRIIRVHTEEHGQSSSRPPSMPSRMSPESHFPPRGDRGEMSMMKSGHVSSQQNVPSMSGFDRREGISLAYFNNLIMEKMRNENSEDMKVEDGHGKPESSIPSSLSNKNLIGGCNPHPQNHAGNPHLGGLAGHLAAQSRNRDDNIGNSDTHRGGDSHSQMDKMDDEPSKGGDSDSPASMVIDESVDMKDSGFGSVKSQSGHKENTIVTSQPNYEPLTDEEN